MNPRDSQPPCRDPFDDALHALLAGEAGERERVILNDTLRVDPEARRAYVRALLFEGMLAAEFAPIDEPAAAPPARARGWFAAAAAAVLLGGFLAWQAPRVFPPAAADDDGETPEITHAVVTLLENAAGRTDGHPLASGLRLAGGMVELDRGLAEITFDSGAEVTLEGPARFFLESGNRSRLDRGKASAVVPEQARGFVIHTPTSYIRDLGTAFAVEVRDDSETDLHVLEGEVEVAPAGRAAPTPPKILRQSEALRLAGGGMQPIRFRPDAPPARNVKRVTRIPRSVHWSFDRWKGPLHKDAARGYALKFRNNGKAAAPDLIEGPFGPALHLDGKAFALSDYPGVGGALARTVACWVRVPPDASGTRPSNGIVAWGVNRSSAKWRVAWNNTAAQGNVGAPRVEFGDGHVIGSTDLRDGRWHHLAVVYLGGPRANVATHVKIYVDGRLESPTGRRQRRIQADIRSPEDRPLVIGRDAGTGKNREPLCFEGDLDELHVFEGALLPKQIVRLMKRNTVRASVR